MNTSLLSLCFIGVLSPYFVNSISDPFNITYPTAVQASLPSQCSLARFDRSGRFVAAGRSDGSAAIWDLETRSTVRWLEGHVKGITSVECVVNSPSDIE